MVNGWAKVYGALTGLDRYPVWLIEKLRDLPLDSSFAQTIELVRALGIPAPQILDPEYDRVDEWCDLYNFLAWLYTMEHKHHCVAYYKHRAGALAVPSARYAAIVER